MKAPTQVPDAVLRGMRKAFPASTPPVEELIKQLRWDTLNRCYSVEYMGTYVGIELDGYVHT